MKDELIEKVRREVESAMNSAIPEEWDVSKNAAGRILTTILEAIKTPTYLMERAALESVAVDDEGPHPSMLDLLDFSGENGAHVAIRAALTASIEQLIKEVSGE